MRVFDNRPTLSRSAARAVYDRFAETGHAGGKDASSGYGGPAIRALLGMAAFSSAGGRDGAGAATRVFEFGCGQAKLAELVLSNDDSSSSSSSSSSTSVPSPSMMTWHGVDQSPKMVEKARERVRGFNAAGDRVRIDFLKDGEPSSVSAMVEPGSCDRFVSTYVLDLLSEEDMYGVLDAAESALDPDQGLLLLAGITWGYRDSVRTFLMTLAWEFLYIFFRKKVGGCRPQNLEPYLQERGWTVVDSARTLPSGFPWMVSEVLSAKPPRRSHSRDCTT